MSDKPYSIQTPRLILRRWQSSDRPALTNLLQNPETMKFSVDGAHDEAQINAWMAASRQHWGTLSAMGHWAIERQDTHDVIGYTKLIDADGVTAEYEVELGIRLLPTGWGQGFAYEATHHAIQDLFEKTRKTRVLGIVDPNNKASVRLLKRLGMVREGEIMFPEYDYPDDLYAVEKGALS